MKHNKKRYYIAMTLSAMMVLNTMPIFADEVKIEVSEYIHDEDCNHAEGQPCIHEHTVDCTTLTCMDETEEHSHSDECFELNCTHLHNADCEYVEARECSCMNQDAGDNQINCTLTEGCNQLSEHEGECETLDKQQGIKVNNWVFNDADNLNEGVLAIPGVNSTNQIDLETLVNMLPKSISMLEGDRSELDIISWNCPEFVIDEDGNWPSSSEYIFTAELPEGYDFELMPSIKVLLGGAELYDISRSNEGRAGDFTVIGDALDYEWNDPVLTIKSETTLTIKNTNPNEPTTHRIVVVPKATNVNITLDGVNIDLSSYEDESTCAFDMTDAVVNLTLAEESKNVLVSNGDRAGIEVPEGAKLTIKGSGTLEVKANHYGSAIGGKGTDTKGINGGDITIMESVIVNAEGGNGAGIGGGYGLSNSGGNGGTVIIQGNAKVTAKSDQGAGIGGGYGLSNNGGDGGKVIIQGNAKVTATSTNGAGIGGGYGNSKGGNGGKVELSGEGVNVIADGMAAIGSSRPFIDTSGGTLSVTDGASLELRNGNADAETVFENCTIIYSNGEKIQYDKDGKASPNLSLIVAPNDSEIVSGDVTVTATLTGADGGNADKNIKFSGNNEEVGVNTDGKGKATYTFNNLNPGDYILTASYAGEGKNRSATASVSIKVKAAPKLKLEVFPEVSQTYPGEVILKATLLGAKDSDEGKTINFTGNVNVSAITNKGGIATYIIKDLSSGDYEFSASYKGDEWNKAASSEVISYKVVLPIVDISSIQGVTVPVRDEIAAKNITETNQYTGSIEWSPALTEDGKFVENKEYTATITLKVKEGYTLEGIGKDFFTVNGALSVETKGNVITAKFPNTGTSSTISTPKNTYQSTSDTINQTISSYNLKSLIRNKKNLTLNSNQVSMTFEPTALKAILDVIPSSARRITFTAVPKEVKVNQDGLKIDPIYDFSISYKDKKGKNVLVNVDFPKGSASIAINHTLMANEKSESLFIVTIDEKGNVTWLDQSSYKDGKVIADVEHYSIYGIAYKTLETTYTDIVNHWAKSDIEYGIVRGLFSDTGNQMFSPDASMTQEMLATALERLNGVEPKAYIKDYKADAYLTREEMAVIMLDYMKESGYTIPSTLKAVKYADQKLISTKARSSVKTMQQAGIIKGKTDNQYDPQDSVTKGQAAVMLHRLIEVMIEPSTANGWQKNDSGQRMYYEKVKALTGWQTLDKLTYYFNENGEMYEGWKLHKNKWYYWNKDGAVTGWKFINGKWYYFESDGVMASSTWVEGYELGVDGAMKVS